jgi:hypothetical protein
VAIGKGWDDGVSCFLSGFGMSTTAMLGVAGVAGFAQLEKMRANRIGTK